ncbi:MAG: NTP transferase domain-containing protein [Gemmatimonadaceae bacterium]|nr:NTP transferase domain-containing protein [Gemmatimonadaceae bacterium]
MITQAIILARGLGTRMRRAEPTAQLDASQSAAAAAGQKAMMPVGDHPLIDHLLSRCADAGITRAAVVIAPEHEAMRAHLTAGGVRRVTVTCVEQLEPRGTADAVFAARGVVHGDAIVLNGDNLYPVRALRVLASADAPALVAFDAEALVRLGNIPAERVRAFAAVELDGDQLIGITERPADGTAVRWVSMNCWALTPAIIVACGEVAPSPRGELELPDAVRAAMAAGAVVRALRSSEPVLDLSQRGDVATLALALRGAECRP